MANRLARESSPYLLLHKDNPVDWHPWGEEAFARARSEDKPIFLSVGYSTCYWCHVMERESFSDPEIARQLNEGFVCVKVDREERPDVDEIYMTATQLITRSGGWPNSVFLTPDLKPFFAGTYFPPADGRGRPGLPRVLQGLREAWLFRRPELLQQAEMVARAMAQHLVAPGGGGSTLPGPEVAQAVQEGLAARFDPEWGGFSHAPKFPSPANLFFLLERSADDAARGMLLTTLDRMARGGLMDQVGGGFHRYSTDEAWLVPHFEKMLYDNASLAWLYAEASSLAPGAGFDRVARSTLDFVLREMTGPDGGFLSAIDAETDGHEGAYYTWTADELDRALPGDEGRLFRAVYGLEGPPPFEGERYVPFLHAPLSVQARTGGLSEPELLRRLEPGRRALLEERSRRERPITDDKVLADWNGLMIGAMSRAGARLAEPRYIAAADARGALRALPPGRGHGGGASPRVPRGPRPRVRLPRRLRLPRRGPAGAVRGDRRAAVARRGGAARRGAGTPPRRCREGRLVLGRRGRAAAGAGEAGLRRSGGIGQRDRRAEWRRPLAGDGRPLVGRAGGGGRPRVRRGDGASAPRARHARQGARPPPAGASPRDGLLPASRGRAGRGRPRPPPRRSRRRPTRRWSSRDASGRATTTNGSRSGWRWRCATGGT